MFISCIYNNQGQEFRDRLFENESSTLAEAFVHDVNYTIDLLNGAPRMNAKYSAFNRPLPIDHTHRIPVIMFKNMLTRYPAFQSGTVFEDNKHLLNELDQLLTCTENQAIPHRLLAIIKQFKIPGISKIEAVETGPINTKNSSTSDEPYFETVDQRVSKLISSKTKLPFVAKKREGHYVDAVLDVSTTETNTIEIVKKYLETMRLPFKQTFFNSGKQLVIENVNVAENVDKFISKLTK